MKLKALLKMENLIKRDRLKFEESFQKGGQGSFAVKFFTTATKI
jgi:hypothetical protein